MKGINVFSAEALGDWPNTAQTAVGWVLARPIGKTGIRWRLKMAWKVFTGEADVLFWKGGQ